MKKVITTTMHDDSNFTLTERANKAEPDKVVIEVRDNNNELIEYVKVDRHEAPITKIQLRQYYNIT